jgi:uncharacterized DUF497 family protein
MDIKFDPAKNAENIRNRGLPFELAGAFEFETAVFGRTLAKSTRKCVLRHLA